MILKKIEFRKIKNSRQKESYNFQKVSAILADYGYTTMKLSDDWNGADFICQHWESGDFYKVQLKGPMTFCQKYIGKQIYLAFRANGNWYLADHDKLMMEIRDVSTYHTSPSWLEIKMEYSFKDTLAPKYLKILEKYRIA